MRIGASRKAATAGACVSAAAIGIFVIAVWHARGTAADRAAASTPVQRGVFRPTTEEWAGLRIEPVKSRTFRAEEIAEGNIAVDDDLTTPVFSPYSGRVTRVIGKLGDRVEGGAPLLAIDASELAQGHNDFVAAAANVKTAKAQLELAQNVEKRQRELYKSNGTALKDWQQSQADLAAAQNNLRTTEAALIAVRNRLRILGRSEAEVAAFEAAPGEQPDATALVRAPVEGIITQRQVGLGQYIQSVAAGAANPVYTIGDLSTVWMVANVREANASRMRVGLPVEVSVPAYPRRVFAAVVRWVGASIDPETHRLPVRADVDNHDGALKPMMFARFRILTGAAEEAPSVPASAVIYEEDTARVWVATDGGGLVSRAIRTGQTSDGNVQVLSGLAAGEKIVVGGSLFIDRAAQGD